MIDLVCTFLVVGAASLALLFFVPGRPPLHESRRRRVLAASVLAVAVALVTLLVDHVMTTVTYRVPAGEPAFTAIVPPTALVLVGALLFGVLIERSIAWNVTRPTRAHAIALTFVSLAVATPLLVLAQGPHRAATDLTDLPPQVVDLFANAASATRVPMFAAPAPGSAQADIADLDRAQCGSTPAVPAPARSAHHCTVVQGHVISQSSLVMPLAPLPPPLRVAAKEASLARICTLRIDEVRCVAAILANDEASALLQGAVDPASLSRAVSIEPNADVAAAFDPRLGAWVMVDWDGRLRFYASHERSVDVSVIDATTLVPRRNDVSSRELQAWPRALTGRWLLFLLPAAIFALLAARTLVRTFGARRELETERDRRAPATPVYRQAAPTEADELRLAAVNDQLVKRTFEAERAILAAFAAAAACAVPLALGTVSHAFDRFPARTSTANGPELAPYPIICPPGSALQEVAGGNPNFVPFCHDPSLQSRGWSQVQFFEEP